MRNKRLLYGEFFFPILLLFLITGSPLQAQSKRINWGFKLGLNALSTTNYEAYNGEEILPNSSYVNKNGYLINTFVRFNLNSVFLQPEIAWNKYRRNYSFALPAENANGYLPATSFDLNSDAINAHFLVGYNIINEAPYLLGFFAGTSFIGAYKTRYSSTIDSFSNDKLTLNYAGILGFCINISNIHFDFRYEFNQPNTNLDFGKLSGSPDSYRNVVLEKNENILSFSCGLMF
jgi:hypothetical protein